MERQYDYSSLCNYVEGDKQWYLSKYGTLDWKWFDEGLIWSIMDYASSVPISTWTDDDLEYLKEWDLTKEEIEYFLEEE